MDFGINMNKKYELEVDEKGRVDIPKDLWRAILEAAKKSKKGKRGLGSKKIRVQKKIVKAELLIAFIKVYNENT